ncbi:MAG: sugar transferase [Cryomorphaceae bacterium]|nr:sugar transferase [Cryomorphaceae bacterium]
MDDQRRGLLFALRLGLEMLAVLLAFRLAFLLRYPHLKTENPEYYDYYLQLAVFLHLLWLVIALLTPSLRRPQGRSNTRQLAGIFRRWAIHLVLLALFIFSLQGYYYSRLFFVYFYAFLLLGSVLAYGLFVFLAKKFRTLLPGWQSRVVLVGNGPAVQRLFQRFIQMDGNEILLGYFSDVPEHGLKCDGGLDAAQAEIEKRTVDELLLGTNNPDTVKFWWALAEKYNVQFTLLPEVQPNLPREPKFHFSDGVLLGRFRKAPLRLWHNRLLKRVFDLIGSLLLLLLTFWWVLPLVYIGIRREGKGSIIFRQSRPGKNERPFDIYKFRTMRPNPEAATREALAGDERITPFGKWLRKYHLDEWPQLWNVLKGEMSLVGPRPHLWVQNEQYREIVEDFMLRQSLRPGITGLAQARGLHGDVSSEETIRARVQEDVKYVENWSLGLDIEILFHTLMLPFFRVK